MSKNCKITAKFENVDLGEIASRQLKNSFKEISEIKIKYNDNSIPELNNLLKSPTGYILGASLLPVNSSTPANGLTSTSNAGFFAFDYFTDYQKQYPSNLMPHAPLNSTESTVIITVPHNTKTCKKIQASLHSLGGLNVKIENCTD